MEDFSTTAEDGISEDRKVTKNRKAQQRYRQRQKEKKENIQQQLQLLNRRLTSMELERQSLSERHRILQRLAQFADRKAEPQRTALGSKAVPVADESRAQAIADFINIIRNNRGPLATAQDLASGPCQRDDTRLVYAQNIRDLQACGKLEEMHDYIMRARKARESMMRIFDLRDELRNPLKAKLRHSEAPFKQSMITVMQLSKDQEEKLLSARRTFLRQCDRLRKQRETSTLDIKRSGSGVEEGTKDKVCAAIMESVEANDAFMNSIVEEHRCVRQYYNTCADLVTPQQEAAALVEGASEDMWLDMWILPNYIEAERAGCLEAWLREVASRGSMNLDYQMIASILPGSQDLQLSTGAASGGACFGEHEAAGRIKGCGLDLPQEGSGSLPSSEQSLQAENHLAAYPPMVPLYTGFDAFEATAFGQHFLPSDAPLSV